MRKMKLFFIACIAFLFIVSNHTAFISVCQAASEDTIQLSFSTVFPRDHLQAKLNQHFCDEIEKRTNGRVKITLYPGGTLTSGTQNFEGVVKGMSDIGMSCPLYVAGRFPVSEIFELPSELDSGWVTAKVYMDLFKKFELKEYEDVHVLYLHGPGRNVLQTRKKPVKKLEDMNGLILRTSGGATSTIDALGATPRAMRMGQAYEALSKGVVDGQFSVPETLKGWKHAEVVNYVSIPPISTSSCQYVAMNKRTWNSLPSDIQKIFTEVSADYPEYHGYVWDYLDKAGFEFFQSLPGRKLNTIPSSQRPKWEDAVSNVVKDYIKEKTEMGLPAEKYVEYFRDRVEYWSPKKPSYEVSEQWVKENLLNP